MRDAVVEVSTEMAERDPRVALITGDLGFGVLMSFAERFPNQFINAGVAEQNMTALACGMALSGWRVYTYSIANFPTLRCLERDSPMTFATMTPMSPWWQSAVDFPTANSACRISRPRISRSCERSRTCEWSPQQRSGRRRILCVVSRGNRGRPICGSTRILAASIAGQGRWPLSARLVEFWKARR